MSDNDTKEIVKAKEEMDKAYTQFIDGAIFASELQGRVLILAFEINNFQIAQDVEEQKQ